MHFAPQTSEDRYYDRIYDHLYHKKSVMEHQKWWLIHNVIAHPLLGLFPGEMTVRFHDYTSDKLNLVAENKYKKPKSPMPVIPNRKLWLIHNCVSHIKIGLNPCKETFAEHDRTAKEQNVKGWV